LCGVGIKDARSFFFAGKNAKEKKRM